MQPAKNRWKTRALLFLISQCITLFGSTLVQMAVIWYVTLQTSSGLWVAAFSVCSYLPQFFISFLGGVWADRFARKTLIILSDAAIASVTLAMYFFLPSLSGNPATLGALLAISVIRSLGAGVQTPAVNAVIPQLVAEDCLMRYNGINAALQSVVQFAAPAAAGVILSFSSLRSTLLADVATAALGIGLLACLWLPRPQETKERPSLLAEIKAGVRYAFGHKLLGRVLMIYGFFIMLCVPGGFMAGLLVSRVFGNGYWYLTAAELAGFAGMAAGGLLMSLWGGFQRRAKTLAAGLAAFGAMAAGMGITDSFVLYLVLMALYGVALTTVQTATATLIQENAESGAQGRVFGLMSSMYSGFLPVGMAIFGPMADSIPLQWIMIGSGAALMLIAAYTAFSAAMR